ncbi:MAG: FlgD immunoglobulin-like domain containing protein [Candidatus Krumholzibacteriota bacterium]
MRPKRLIIPFISILSFFAAVSFGVPAVPGDYSGYPHLDRIEYFPEKTYAVEAFSLWGDDYFAVCNEITGLNFYQIVGGEAVHVGVESALGSERDVAIVDWTAYVATGSQGLSRLSVAVPSAPIETDTIVLPGTATRVAASATHAYVACGTGGLAVVDLTAPGTMYQVGSYGTDVEAVSLAGSRLGVINDGRFEILDVSTPAIPVLLGTHDDGAPYHDAVIRGDLAYVVNPRDVERLDITVPGAIAATDTMDLNGPYYLYHSRLEIEGDEVLVAADHYLGILDFASGTVLRETKQVGDVVDAASIAGKIMTVADDRLEIFNDGLHDHPESAGVFHMGDAMHIQGFLEEDVLWGQTVLSLPATLVAAEIGGTGGFLWSLDMDLPGEYMYGKARRGSTVAVITNSGILRLASVSRHGAVLQGAVALADIYLPQSDRVLSFLDDDTLVIMDTGAGELSYNIRVVDVSDPYNPAQIGLYPLTMGYAAQVMTSGSLVFAASHFRVEVFDAADRTALVSLAVHNLGVFSNRIYVRDSWLYSTHSGSSASMYSDELLQTWDISDILNPVSVDVLYTPRHGFLTFEGNWAYQEYTGMILDLSDPAHPDPVGNFSLPSPSVSQHLDIFVSREYIVTSAWPPGATGAEVHYMAAHLGTGDISSVGEDVPVKESGLALEAVPNPFNPRVTFRFDLAADSLARLEIFDLRGRRVADLGEDVRQAGPHSVTWDGVDRQGRSLPSGVYLARISTAEGTAARKIVLAR